MSLPDNRTSGHGHNSNRPTQTHDEYYKALEKWLREEHAFQHLFQTLSLNVIASEMEFINRCNQLTHRMATQPAAETPPGPETHLPAFAQNGFQRPQTVEPNVQAVQCKIPPVWKRVVAEFLDFLILFFVKLAITFIAVDYFDIINLDKYGIQVMDASGNINYKTVLAATSEILMLEFIHRIVVCIFEAYWLWNGTGGQVGGATPGKAMMGLRVLTCSKVENVDNRPPDVVLVQPGTDLGLVRAILRAVLKNIVLAVLFPLCFVFFFFKHNRTGYDLVCNSIVVEGCRRRP